MARETLKHYVEFLYPGLLFDESAIEPVRARDAKSVRAPREAFAFRFFDRQEYKAADGEFLVGKPRNHSGRYYFGKVMTLEDVQREVPDSDILQGNMRNNGYKKVVRTRRGNFQPFSKGDVIVAEK